MEDSETHGLQFGWLLLCVMKSVLPLKSGSWTERYCIVELKGGDGWGGGGLQELNLEHVDKVEMEFIKCSIGSFC